MFKPKNIHNGILGLQIGKRFVFKKPEAKEAAPQTAEKELTPQELQKLLGEGVAYKDGVHETIKSLAEKLYGNSERGRRWSAERIAAWDEALKMMPELLLPAEKKRLKDEFNGDIKALVESELKKQVCQTFSMREANNRVFFSFLDDKGKEILRWPPDGIAIKAVPIVRDIESETTADQEAALKYFKEKLKLKAKIGPTVIGEGSVARIPNTRELAIYTEKGKQTISTDTLGEFTQSDCRITKPFTIMVGRKEMVYIETKIVGRMGEREYKGWVERTRLSDVNLTRPEEKVAITVDEKKVAQEKEARAKAEKEKERARTAKEGYLDADGIVHLTNPEDTKKISLNTLFPEAVDGDSVQVTHKIGGHMETAVYNADKKDWLNEKNKHVPVYNGDKVVKTSNIGASLEQATAIPEGKPLPIGYSYIEKEPRLLTPEQAKKTNWNEVAKALYKEFPQLAQTGITTLEYAKILSKSATDTGYYWVILPPKAEKKPTEESKKAIDAGYKTKEARDKRGNAERDKKAYAAYDKYKNALWENEYIGIEGLMDELINTPAKWNEAWTNNYPINRDLILQAFKRPPYDKIPVMKIRDGLREMLYASVGQNKFDFSDFFKYFNQQGTIYMYLGERAGDLSDLKKEYQILTEDLPKKVQENKDNNKPVNYDLSDDEAKIFKKYWSYTDRANELRDVVIGAAVIVDALDHGIRHKSEAPKFARTVPVYKVSEMDSQFGQGYRDIIWKNEDVETRENMDDIINDEKAWEEFWTNNRGNVKLLKKALQRPPFNRLGGAEKTLIREAMHDVGKNALDMSDILDDLNPDGLIYKTREDEKGDLDDFKKEYWEEQVGYKIKNNQAVSAGERRMYDEHPNKDTLGNRYKELAELFVSSAYVLDAVKMLDTESTYEESVPEAEKPRAFLDDIFPPNDTGSINGVPQDYYSTYKEDGTRIAGGGLFTGGLFVYDFRDRYKGITDFDMTSSYGTANDVIRDACFDYQKNGVDAKKLQFKLNELIHLGIASLVSEYNAPNDTDTDDDKTRRQELLTALGKIGIKEADLSKKSVIAETAKRHTLNLSTARSLTEAQRDLIRLGFLVERAAKPGEFREVPEGAEAINWSSDPKVRRMQNWIKQNYPDITAVELEEFEKKMSSTLLAIFHAKVAKNFDHLSELGITVPIRLAGEGKTALYLAITPQITKESGESFKPALHVGIGGSVEIAEGVALVGGIGFNHKGNFSAALGMQFDLPPIPNSAWRSDITFGALLGTDYSSYDVIVGAALGFHRNLGEQYKLDLEENLERAGYSAIEKAGDVHTKADLLRKLPGPNGAAIAQMDAYLNLTDEQLVNLYERHIRRKLALRTAQAGLSEHKFLGFLPPITDVGLGVGLKISGGVDRETGAPKPTEFSVVPGLAFAIALGSELIVFQRPTTSDQSLERSADARMNMQAEDRIRKNFVETAKKAGYTTVNFVAEPLLGDMESGLRPSRVENSKSSTSPVENPESAELDKHFKEWQAEMLSNGMKITMKPKTRPPMYELVLLNVGNYQVHVDPQMRERIGVFLGAEGKIYIAANRNPKLVIKRQDRYFPRVKDGNIKHTYITISDEDFRTQEAIRAESDFYIESQTKDNTGTERSVPAIKVAHGERTAKQHNLRAWKSKEFNEGLYDRLFDNLDTTTAEMTRYREIAAERREYSTLAREIRNNIGEAELGEVDMPKMHEFAEGFMKKHPVIYRKYTTYQISSEPDLNRLNTQIKKDFKELNGRDMSEDELTIAKEEMFNLSMSEAEKKIAKLPEDQRLPAKRALLRQKIDWMKNAIYVPFFRKHSIDRYNPKGFTPEQLAEAFIAPLRQMAETGDFENPETIALGARLDVAVGTENIVGRRGIIAGRPQDIENHRIFEGKDYSQALVSGKPEIDHTIALIFRESQRPLETIDPDAFLSSPMAMRLMLMGTEKGNPALIKAIGEENYRLIADCYKTKPPKKYTEMEKKVSDAVMKLANIALKLSAAQEGKGTKILIDGKEYYSITENGVVLAIRTLSHKSGVYERCLNASHLYNEEMVAFSQEEKYVMVGKAKSYSARNVQDLSSTMGINTIDLAFGIAFEFGPEAAPPPEGDIPPGGGEPEKPEGGPGGRVIVKPGSRFGGGRVVATPKTPIGGDQQPDGPSGGEAP